MKPALPNCRFEPWRCRNGLRAWTLLALVATGPTAWAQLGSFNQTAEPLASVSLATAAGPSLPVLESATFPLQSLNEGPTLPTLVTKLFSNLLLAIPDNSAVGVAQEQTVSGIPGSIASLSVQLTISSRGAGPMFNGDLFVSLNHSSGYSVLLNRVGRRPDSVAGYGDNGFNFTLADSAAADVHSYRVSLGGSDLVPISSANPAAPLTGSWQPDGRTADPEAVLTGSPRITSLAAFNGMDPNGTWTLFVADLGSGGLAQLESWSLEFAVVPEPEITTAVTGTLLLAAALCRRRCARR